MNACLGNKYLTTQGLKGALEIARVLIKNGYQVFIQEDELDTYIVGYAYNDSRLGDPEFALLTQEEIDTVLCNRQKNEEDN